MTDLAAPQWLPPQEPDEAPEAYAGFVAWAYERPRRSLASLPAGVAELAMRHRWLARAQALDTYAPVAGLTPRQHAERAVQALAQAHHIGALKLLREWSESASAPKPAELASLAGQFLGAPAPERGPQLTAADLDRLTPEERQEFVAAAATLRRLRARLLAAREEPTE